MAQQSSGEFASLSRGVVVFILIAAIVAFVSGIIGLFTIIDLVQSQAPERSGASVAGLPLNFELDLQSPFSPFQHDIYTFHSFLLVKDLVPLSQGSRDLLARGDADPLHGLALSPQP